MNADHMQVVSATLQPLPPTDLGVAGLQQRQTLAFPCGQRLLSQWIQVTCGTETRDVDVDFFSAFRQKEKKDMNLNPVHQHIQGQFHRFLKRRQACNLYDLLMHHSNPASLRVIPVLWHHIDDKRHMHYTIRSVVWDQVRFTCLIY